MSQHKNILTNQAVTAEIESMTYEGRAVTHISGKTVFIDGALPGEEVEFIYTKTRRNYDEGRLADIIKASPHRVEPRCAHFGLCGGCSLQHLAPSEQVANKQTILLDVLKHIAKITPQNILAPITGPVWGYRKKARLGARYVSKKKRILVGFREKRSNFLADLTHCKILDPQVGENLTHLAALIQQLSCYTRIPQVEVAAGDEETALVFRNLETLTREDIEKLAAFGKEYNFLIYHQPKGPDSIELLYPQQASLSYRLPEFGVEVYFRPSDFTQVNSDINRKMVSTAISLLQLQADDTVLELFCGLGNFTLAMAKQARRIVAVEGDKVLIERARRNAERNGLSNIDYHVTNLMDEVSGQAWLDNYQYDKILLDPPRLGAYEIIPQLMKTKASKIAYVSCNPATLARDAHELVRSYGYTLRSAGVMDMFPHTAHVESIALFEQ